MRHTQRQVLMADPNWKRGFYYDGVPPHVGMKLAREIATITYRSGPEWEERFGRDRADPSKTPALCPDFLIETYLDHAGEKFCLEYDPNSLLYVSKAMDLFDLGAANRARAQQHIAEATDKYNSSITAPTSDSALTCSLPTTPYKEQPRAGITEFSKQDLIDGMRSMANHKVLVLGVDSDILFPSWQQREIADMLKAGSDYPEGIEYIELGQDISLFGHDTFLLAVDHVGGPMKRFLERS
ncbi:hypothetical protein D0Z00_000931 [Geotrichum galactomycetum]|uniref:Uncharacterized protein n=1 Tax=Geotrichum galactomycetum TaxID=27317 RepID=A0ACB6V8E3_9ASCO|nr:hypothetical protein D0Z00_000931 [Geotrichum candidum]